mmetsp:Transcript_36524/g.91566  ORF Transcript_36524/g.91566 Transcript_36524/m.91566 type:complete len:141 (-) Transcript_36524:69-491(-)|eukprot:CAMPEP_0177663762 /NCGR_PEP_ID=MMETSP0447-20121125/20100_1 /TAXON_ID=0 /ORGANISM="Stygamoeba regulata, Strain BSH-02190019" /LENGTH=140 /DNA_ID=CAMNT_0019169623 /DNA_START=109 /DNA_END=531 /DNA_ORIENTATION=+
MARRLIDISVAGYDKRTFTAVERLAASLKLIDGLNVMGPNPLPKQYRKWTVNRSPFVDKKSRETFELVTIKRLIKIEGDVPTTNKFLKALPDLLAPYPELGTRVNVHTFSPITRYYSFQPVKKATPEDILVLDVTNKKGK